MKKLGIVAGVLLLFSAGAVKAAQKSDSDPSKKCRCTKPESYDYYQNFGYPGYYPPDGNFDFEYYSELYYHQNN